MGQYLIDVKPESFCSPKCPQMDLHLAENAVMYANDEIYTREVVIGCRHAKLCAELRKRIVQEIEAEQELSRTTHVAETPMTLQLKEFIKDPQHGDKDYGKWGALNREQRNFLRKCAEFMEAQEYTIKDLINGGNNHDHE